MSIAQLPLELVVRQANYPKKARKKEERNPNPLELYNAVLVLRRQKSYT